VKCEKKKSKEQNDYIKGQVCFFPTAMLREAPSESKSGELNLSRTATEQGAGRNGEADSQVPS